MPAEILLPAFALTLLANAILVAAAIRALRGNGRSDKDVRPVIVPRATADAVVPSVAAPEAEPPKAAAEPEIAIVEPARVEPAEPAGVELAGVERAEPAGVEPPEPVEPAVDLPIAPTAPRRARRAPTDAPKPEVARPPAPTAGKGRGRRRFALPPLDDDHDKVSRSIESFLSGGDPETTGLRSDPAPDAAVAPTDPPLPVTAASDVGSEPRPAAEATTAPGASAGATTVALVAVEPDVAVGRGTRDWTAVLPRVEGALRSAARGTDIVTVQGRGRYRIVLAGTGELAARAYLRRVRSTIDPILETSRSPVRLRVVTATTLGGPLRPAIALAERRLAASRTDRDAPRSEEPDAEADAGPSPRAAAD